MSLNKGNQKAQRSQQSLQKAMLALLKEKPFESITIQELADLAGLSRRTFYRNYNHKVEIIDDLLVSLWESYKEMMSSSHAKTINEVTQQLYEIATNNKELILLLDDQHLLYRLATLAANHLPELVVMRHPESAHLDHDTLKFAAQFIVGGYFQVIPNWIRNHTDITPEQMGRYLRSMMSLYHDPNKR